jgi:hypothetical protein
MRFLGNDTIVEIASLRDPLGRRCDRPSVFLEIFDNTREGGVPSRRASPDGDPNDRHMGVDGVPDYFRGTAGTLLGLSVPYGNEHIDLPYEKDSESGIAKVPFLTILDFRQLKDGFGFVERRIEIRYDVSALISCGFLEILSVAVARKRQNRVYRPAARSCPYGHLISALRHTRYEPDAAGLVRVEVFVRDMQIADRRINRLEHQTELTSQTIVVLWRETLRLWPMTGDAYSQSQDGFRRVSILLS